MKKFIRRIAILLCICLIAPTILNCIPNVVATAEAAKKAKLYTSKGTIGVASSPESIYIDNQNYDAKYTFKSSNTKVVKVDKYGVLTGVKTGTAKITVKETYKKKTVTVGTYKVTVVNSKLGTKSADISLFGVYYLPIEYKNLKAKYTGKAEDSSIATIDKEGFLVGLKEGQTTITISETYKGKTRKLGKLKVNVIAPSINPETTKVTVGINQLTDPSSIIYIDNFSWEATYSYESADPTIVSVSPFTDDYGYSYLALKGEKLGTTTLTVYSEYQGQKTKVGDVEVTVAEIPVTSFGFDEWTKDETGTFTMKYYLGEENYPLTYYLYREPYNSTTPITFASSDPSIATVDENGKVTTIKEGTVEITATCGTFSDKAVITVENYSE